MWRKLLNIATVLSLLLSVATAVPWVQSRARGDVRFNWGAGLDTGDGYVSPNVFHYQEGTLYFTRVRPPLISRANLGDRPAGAIDLYPLGLHVRRGYWRLMPGRDVTLYRCIVWFPGWWPPAAAGILPAAWLWARWRERRRPSPGSCASCDYDLRATPERCPECGSMPANTARPAA